MITHQNICIIQRKRKKEKTFGVSHKYSFTGLPKEIVDGWHMPFLRRIILILVPNGKVLKSKSLSNFTQFHLQSSKYTIYYYNI